MNGNPQALQLIVDSASRNAHSSGNFTQVPARLSQQIEQTVVLQLADVFAPVVGRRVGMRGLRLVLRNVLQGCGKVAYADPGSLRHSDGPVHDVRELTNVARPAVPSR